MIPLAAVASVTAYCLLTPTATGHKPRVGIVAGPRRQLGHYVRIQGRTYLVDDVKPSGGYDIWMPSRKAALRWGVRKLPVTLLKRRR